MATSFSKSPAEPFFLDVGSRKLFCLYHTPARGRECRGVFLYVHPFAEEMNRSRRMAALQARSFASLGFGVLQVDLFGCGDSEGDFSDARWELWKEDLTAARKWLEDRASVPVSIWGLRMGALLALDFAADQKNAIDKLVLWQPVVNGESFLTQFLRMRLASERLVERNKQKMMGTKEMRAVLAAGESLEVAGYMLSPALAASIDRMHAKDLAPRHMPVHWFEVASETGRPLTPATSQIATAWTQKGTHLHVHPVTGGPFWASQEVSECQSLLGATTSIFAEVRP